MKILLISPFFPPEVGSASHLYFELGQEFRRRGHEVMVITGLPRYHVTHRGGNHRQRLVVRERYEGLQVWRVFNLDIPWNVPLLRGLDQFVFALSAGLAGILLPGFDAALVYSPPLPLALAALGLCRLRRRPLVVNVQDLFPQSAVDLGVLKNPFLIRAFRSMERFLYRFADRVVVHSEGNRKHVRRNGAAPGKVTVVPNWIDPEVVKPGRPDNWVRAELGLNGRFVASFAGVMGYSQDLATVLECARLLSGHPEIAFLLVGDGVEKPRLMAMAQEHGLKNVHFLPMQPKERYPDILAASDVCLATLRKEVKTPVVPSKILSIMAAGRPVLASLPLEGAAPQLIAQAGCGVVIPPQEPDTMARTILELYHDAEGRRRMGQRGRQYAEQHLSVAVVAGQFEGILQKAGSY